ncbi:MAG: hypothetical protein ABW192_00640, partial [Sphingobium sp.]
MLPSAVAIIALVAAYSFADAQVAIPGWAQAGGDTPSRGPTPLMVQPTPGPTPLMVQPIPGQDGAQDWSSVSSRIAAPASPADQSIDATIAEWRRLQQADTLGFYAYSSFVLTNPGWPGEDRLRRLAEAQADPSGYNSGQTIAFFS